MALCPEIRKTLRARVVVSVLLNPPTRRRTHRNCAATPKHFETTSSGANPGCGLSPFLCGVWKKLSSSGVEKVGFPLADLRLPPLRIHISYLLLF
jgi:hypothetical protein